MRRVPYLSRAPCGCSPCLLGSGWGVGRRCSFGLPFWKMVIIWGFLRGLRKVLGGLFVCCREGVCDDSIRASIVEYVMRNGK